MHEPVGVWSFVPFMLKLNDGKIKVNRTRIAEAVIIALITALVSSYILVQKLEIRLNYIEKQTDVTSRTLQEHINSEANKR